MNQFDLTQYIEELKQWQLATFGEGDRTEALVKHIRRELREIEENPGDLMEWVDVMILAIEGHWRGGYDMFGGVRFSGNEPPYVEDAIVEIDWLLDNSPIQTITWLNTFYWATRGAFSQGFALAQIQQALVDKLATNKVREWPKLEDRVEGQPVEHVR